MKGMRRSRSLTVVALAVSLCLGLGGTMATADSIYVLSQTGAALSEIADGAAPAAAADPIALEKAPAALALRSDGKLAYVTHPDLGKVAVVDLAQRRVVRTLEPGGSPFGVALAKDGRLFVGDWNGSHVSVMDANGKVATTTVQVGRAPAHIVLGAEEKLLFVANRESDSVTVVRTEDLAVVAIIPVGKAPFAMALSPNGARLYVGNVQSGTVSVIDTATLAVVEVWKSGAMPYGSAVTDDGSRVLITNQQSGTVAVLQGEDVPPLHIKVGSYPEGIGIAEGGARGYVANWFSDDVSVIDLATLKEVRRVKVPGGPRSIAVWREKVGD
jgi:YVTN family beta-propeller protein